MKRLLLPLLLLFGPFAFAQKVETTEIVTDYSTHIIGDDFEGVVFGSNYLQHPQDTAEIKIKRYTPSTEDVVLAESIIIKETLNRENTGDKKDILSNLKKYRRQYIGYFDANGKKCIYINCFPNDEDWATQKVKRGNKLLNIPKWYDSLFQVLDGGDSFWQMHINLDEKRIISMSWNGVA